MWIVFAVAASMLWGLLYVLNEQIYKSLSIGFSFFIASLAGTVFFLLLTLQQGVLAKDWYVLVANKNLQWLLAIDIAVFLAAEMCIAMSIAHKNATLAGLIEISYPVFIAIFAYYLFKEETLNVSTIAGALLIFSGIFVIYHFNH